MGVSTVSNIVMDTCTAIWEILHEDFMPKPSVQQWKDISRGFHNRWHFPNCVGALDGKHCRIIAPSNSGTVFFNYKKHFSLNLMAIADAWYRFIMVDVGAAGSESDSYVFRSSAFGKLFTEGNIELPPPEALPGSDIIAPYVLIGDEAFPSKETLLKPYSRRNLYDNPKLSKVFNYRLSRARMSVECAFGILSQKFRFLDRKISSSPKMAEVMIKAACVLHNYLLHDSEALVQQVQEDVNALGERKRLWNGNLKPLPPLRGYHSSSDAREVRHLFAEYFQSNLAALPWQERFAHVEEL